MSSRQPAPLHRNGAEGGNMKRLTFTIALIAILLAVSLTPAVAQGRGRGYPDNAFQIRLGQFFAAGGGDLWNDNEEFFTMDISDFNDIVWGFSFVNGFSNQLEIGLNVDFYSESVFSSYRDYVDEAGFPIYHDTRLDLMPATVDLRFLPGGRYRMRPGGRQVLKPTFYIGGGGGLNFWEYEEVGDFIDFGLDPPEVFYSRYKDSGTAWEAHALAGFELPLSPGFNFLVEGRYSWSEDTLGGSLAGLGDIDLGGYSLSVGGSFRF
jgi:hypothetical protein